MCRPPERDHGRGHQNQPSRIPRTNIPEPVSNTWIGSTNRKLRARKHHQLEGIRKNKNTDVENCIGRKSTRKVKAERQSREG